MKIIYIHPFVFPSRAANTIQVIKMCEAFYELGHDIELYCFEDQKDNYKKIIKFYGLEFNLKIIKVRKFMLFNINISKIILLIIALKKNFFLKNALFYTRDIKISFILNSLNLTNYLELHFPINFKNMQLLKYKIIKKKKFQKLVLISNALKKIYEDHDIISKKIIVAHDGANISSKLSKKFFTEKNIIKACYIGSFYTGRGISIIAELSKNLPEIKFTLYGGSKSQLAELRKKYSNNNISFRKFIENHKINNILLENDIALMPYEDKVSTIGHDDTSKWMSPLKMFEYMANKMIIVSSNHNVLREVLNNNNSFIVKKNDIDNWKETIKEILNNKTMAIYKANNAYKDAITYSWQNRIKKILN